MYEFSSGQFYDAFEDNPGDLDYKNEVRGQILLFQKFTLRGM